MSSRAWWMCLVGALVLLALFSASCAPEVGSARWCEKMDGLPKGDWTPNQAVDYAKHCVFR